MSTPDRIRVRVLHSEPFMFAGLTATLSRYDDLEVLTPGAGGQGGGMDAEVILTDYATGIEMSTREFKARRDRAKVIIVSSSDRECEIRNALALGVRGYVVVGSSLEDLVSSVRAVHLGLRHLSPQVARRLAESMTWQPLTAREEEVLRLVVEGLCNKVIASRLDIAVGTVKSHLKGVFDKLNVTSRTQAIVAVERRGLLSNLRDSSGQQSAERHHGTPAAA